jgi:hypothetical protein
MAIKAARARQMKKTFDKRGTGIHLLANASPARCGDEPMLISM